MHEPHNMTSWTLQTQLWCFPEVGNPSNFPKIKLSVHQRCLRRESWRCQMRCSFSEGISSSADLLLSPQGLLTWQAAVSLPLRCRLCSNFRATFSTYQREDLNISIAPLQGLPDAPCFCTDTVVFCQIASWMSGNALLPCSADLMSVMLPSHRTWGVQQHNLTDLPLCGSGAYTEAVELLLLHFCTCLHGRSGTPCYRHSAKGTENIFIFFNRKTLI